MAQGPLSETSIHPIHLGANKSFPAMKLVQTPQNTTLKLGLGTNVLTGLRLQLGRKFKAMLPHVSVGLSSL